MGETFEVLGKYRWEQLAVQEIPVYHALMIHPEASIEDISIIMGHDQAIRQCENTLATLFPQIPKVAGVGEYMDNAAIAEGVATGKLPKHIASIGHVSLADIYGLTVVQENLQDRSDNRTTFLIVER